jgi:tRNA pseudouridine55 synthase
MDNLILINKPKGISSTQVGAKVRYTLGEKKMGHAGTLDPDATGLLLLLSGSACRFQSHLLGFKKEYMGIIRFGVSSSTDDMSGDVTEYDDVSRLSDSCFRKEIEQRVFSEFNGLIRQVAPDVSAKKTNGVPDYVRVRNGEPVIPKEKEVEVKVIEFEFIDESRVMYHLEVSSGFYVRAFARDAGYLAGIPAVAESISRISVGPFLLSDAIDYEQVLNGNIKTNSADSSCPGFMSISDICQALPYKKTVVSDSEDCEMIKNGNPAFLEKLEIDSGHNLLYNVDGYPLAIVNREEDRVMYSYVLPST